LSSKRGLGIDVVLEESCAVASVFGLAMPGTETQDTLSQMNTTSFINCVPAPVASCILFCVALGCGAQGKDTQAPLQIPPPVGFIGGATLSDAIRRRALAGQPASAKVLGSYYETNTLAGILKDDMVDAPVPYCSALLKKEYASIPEAKAGFEKLVNAARKEASNFDPQ
jgi:hypothetical protein